MIIASNNAHKVRELAQMVAASSVPAVRELEVMRVADLPYGASPEIEESEQSFAGNALLKVNGIAAWLRMHDAPKDDLVLADDSGLCVDAFDGGPGVRSARFAMDARDGGEQGAVEGDAAANNARLVRELEARELGGSAAEYVCVLALRRVGQRPFDFTLPDSGALFMRDGCLCIEGRAVGEVRVARRGEGGFGYDPHFWIDGGSRTYAELTMVEKSRRSHRGAAMRRLIAELPLVLD
nr:non-canonical purine NTP pyrophosphatase [Pseudenhygromyxa sp. WMMC2535]